MRLRNGDRSKQAGSNNFTITSHSDDWRMREVSVTMTVRDAQTLKRFLNENLECE
jgi:hypothetical protein